MLRRSGSRSAPASSPLAILFSFEWRRRFLLTLYRKAWLLRAPFLSACLFWVSMSESSCESPRLPRRGNPKLPICLKYYGGSEGASHGNCAGEFFGKRLLFNGNSVTK